MKTYSPFHLTPKASLDRAQDLNERAAEMSVSDETLKVYVETFLQVYRSTIERFFQTLAPFIPFYTNYPFETLILRVYNNGVIIGFKPSADASVKIMRPADFDPPLVTVNIFNIIEQWQVQSFKFDFSTLGSLILEAVF